MKVVVSKVDLVNVIGKLQTIVASKPAIPVLANVLLKANARQLILIASDLTVIARYDLDATVVKEGSIALPARRLFQLIRELTAPQIKITAQTNEIAEITTGTSLFKINGMGETEFPQLPDLSGSPEVSLSSSLLKQLLTKTAFSAAREDSRYMLNGVFLQIAHQQATFIGTDGKRLAKTTAPLSIEPSLQGNYVLPLKAVEEIIRMLDESDGKASLSLSPDKIAVEYGPVTLTTKLLAGQYPDVARVIPKELTHQFSVHREELITLLRQTALFTSETSGSVRLSFETGQLHLTAMSSEIGEGRVSMPVDYAGPKLDIAFNPYFLIDILRHSNDETVRFGLNDPHNPGLITDSTQAIFVIMPMRLHDAPAPRKEADAAVV